MAAATGPAGRTASPRPPRHALHPGFATPHLRTPVLALIAPEDEMPGADPTVARAAIEAARAEILEIEGGHFGLLGIPASSSTVSSGRSGDFLLRILA